MPRKNQWMSLCRVQVVFYNCWFRKGWGIYFVYSLPYTKPTKPYTALLGNRIGETQFYLISYNANTSGSITSTVTVLIKNELLIRVTRYVKFLVLKPEVSSSATTICTIEQSAVKFYIIGSYIFRQVRIKCWNTKREVWFNVSCLYRNSYLS